MRTWRRRVIAAAVLFVGIDVLLILLDFDPDHLRLGLLVALGVTVSGLVLDSMGDSGPPWTAEGGRDLVPAGADERLAGYVRLLESHLTADAAGTGLRDRLAALCDERLERRHGLTRSDPEARELLGVDLAQDLSGPPRRLSRAEIDDYVRRIEDL